MHQNGAVTVHRIFFCLWHTYMQKATFVMMRTFSGLYNIYMYLDMKYFRINFVEIFNNLLIF